MNHSGDSHPIIVAHRVCQSVLSQNTQLDILSNISFSLPKGQSMAILGASGSGKSTLLGLLAGLAVPTQGQIVLDGLALEQCSEEQRAHHRKHRVGFVFQNFQLIPGLTALENVNLVPQILGQRHHQSKAKALLEKVGLTDRLHHYPSTLSGGEQQRVALARAFVHEPKVLFADEPTGNLDTHTAQDIITLLFDLNQRVGTTLVFATHDPALSQHCQHTLNLS